MSPAIALQCPSTALTAAITSIAKSLGAATVSAHAFQAAADEANAVSSVVCTDADAVSSCLSFADEHRVLVEPACGAGLASVYNRAEAVLRCCAEAGPDRPVVIEVCGGALVDRETLASWADAVGVAN